MSSLHAPSAGGTHPAGVFPGVKRSFSVPARRSASVGGSPGNPQGDTEGVETLFTHTFAKVVAFSLSPSSRPSSSSSRGTVVADSDFCGKLPWISSTERTIAAGPLRIYRVPGTVSFLNSGPLLHTIFPRSQCWCVDGESKFVLRIRQSSYYRIELPYGTDEEKTKAVDLKDVLDKVLQYEKTPCPFERGFDIEIPEQPPSVTRRKSLKPPERAKRWVLDDNGWEPENSELRARRTSVSSLPPTFELEERTGWSIEERTGSPFVAGMIPEEDSLSVLSSPLEPTKMMNIGSPGSTSTLSETNLDSPTTKLSLRRKLGNSKVSDTAQKWLFGSSGKARPQLRPQLTSETANSMSSSKESFYSASTSVHSQNSNSLFEDAHSRVDSPNLPEVYDEPTRGRSHSRQVSEITVTGTENRRLRKRSSSFNSRASSAPPTPALESDSDDIFESQLPEIATPPSTIRLRRLTGASQRRAFSPMPHPINIWSPSVRSSRNKQLTATIVQRTYALLFGPPTHLVALMLRIATRIANGAFGNFTYRLTGKGDRVPGRWESSSDEDWGEDDYGIPLRNVGSSATLRRRDRNSTWELD